MPVRRATASVTGDPSRSSFTTRAIISLSKMLSLAVAKSSGIRWAARCARGLFSAAASSTPERDNARRRMNDRTERPGRCREAVEQLCVGDLPEDAPLAIDHEWALSRVAATARNTSGNEVSR
jgi:hypothetical protein